jgi:hypothetical protein
MRKVTKKNNQSMVVALEEKNIVTSFPLIIHDNFVIDWQMNNNANNLTKRLNNFISTTKRFQLCKQQQIKFSSISSSKKISTMPITIQRNFNSIRSNSRDFSFVNNNKDISTLQAPPRELNSISNNKKIEQLY